VRVLGPTGETELWIEVGQPSVKKLQLAPPKFEEGENLRLSGFENASGRAAGAFRFPREDGRGLRIGSRVLESLAETLESDNEWSVTHSGGSPGRGDEGTVV